MHIKVKMKLFLIVKKKTLLLCALIIAVFVTVAVISSTLSVSVFAKKRSLPIYSVETDKKEIAISFDCAWGVDYTDKLLEIMDKENVNCTFFTVKFWVEKYPEYVRKIDSFGHEIGTHSSTHPYMSKLDKKTIIKELTDSALAIKNITGKEVTLFRPPYGDYNNLLIDTCKELAIYPIQWDTDSLDWKNLSSSEIQKRVLSKVKNGSIVLFHNNGLHTAEALPFIIKELKNQGYEFKRIGDLIYKENYVIDANGRQKSEVKPNGGNNI